MLAAVGDQLQSPVAMLLHVPQQPIFDGKVEDEIISLTFAQFYQTGDTEWPLLVADGQERRPRHGRGAGISRRGVEARHRELHGHRRVETRLDHVADLGGRSRA